MKSENPQGPSVCDCTFTGLDIIRKEIPMVEKIFRDECWYKGERLHRRVLPQEVETEVAEIVSKVGTQMWLDAFMQVKEEKCKGCANCRWKFPPKNPGCLS